MLKQGRGFVTHQYLKRNVITVLQPCLRYYTRQSHNDFQEEDPAESEVASLNKYLHFSSGKKL